MIASILTNSSALTALQGLATVQKSLATTQAQISSGPRVATASDNAAYWSIATALKSDTGALSSVSDALSLGASVLDVTAAAINSTIARMSAIKSDLVTAQQSGTSLAQVQTDIAAQQKSIVAVLSSASFNGVNLLDGSASGGSVSFVTGFMRSPSGSTSVLTTSVATGNLFNNGTQLGGTTGLLSYGYLPYGAFGGTPVNSAVYGTAGTDSGTGGYQAASFLSFDITQATATDLSSLQRITDNYIGYATTMGTIIGTAQSVVANQKTYITALSDALTSGVGALVDADMNVAATRLQALQTQQQLGIQALSIANQNSQIILKLFQAA